MENSEIPIGSVATEFSFANEEASQCYIPGRKHPKIRTELGSGELLGGVRIR